MADTLDKISEIVPTLYYDLIARFVPGAATLGAYLYFAHQSLHELERNTHLTGAAFIAVLIGGSYLLGLVLTPIGTVSGALFAKLANAYTRSNRYRIDEVWKKVDELARKDPAAAPIFGKMAAEVTLCENLFAGVLIVVLISQDGIWPPKIFGWLALLFANVGLRMVLFVERLERIHAA